MLELLADNTIARLSLLGLLFMAVAIGTFAVVNVSVARAQARQRLSPEASVGTGETIRAGSLRSDASGSAWAKLVDAIEKSGLSLVDTRDQQLRQRLVSAGFTAPYAPRVYTLVRLVMVVGLPAALLTYFWL